MKSELVIRDLHDLLTRVHLTTDFRGSQTRICSRTSSGKYSAIAAFRFALI